MNLRITSLTYWLESYKYIFLFYVTCSLTWPIVGSRKWQKNGIQIRKVAIYVQIVEEKV